jgi:hypothetical protein
MKIHRCLAAFSMAAAACGTVDGSAPELASYDDGKADSSGSIFQRVKILDMGFSEETPIDDQQAAAVEATHFLAAVEDSSLGFCALDLHVPRTQVFGRFDGCRAFAQPVTFTDSTKWAPAFQCDAAFCALHPIDDAEVVRFDGTNLHTVSGNALADGSSPIIMIDLGKVSAMVSSEDFTHGFESAHGVAAVVPHLFVRTDGGPFVEAPRPPALPHNAGAQLSLGFDPAALRLVLPAHADRIELYMRFERWNYTRLDGEDASTAARLDSRATDQFVSNFGDNYVLPVQ